MPFQKMILILFCSLKSERSQRIRLYSMKTIYKQISRDIKSLNSYESVKFKRTFPLLRPGLIEGWPNKKITSESIQIIAAFNLSIV